MSDYDFYKDSRSDVIYVQIKSAEDMARLGRDFGVYFLQPLLENNANAIDSLVTAAYGAHGIGKSIFGVGAFEAFPRFYRRITDTSQSRSGDFPLRGHCALDVFGPRRHDSFRWMDFGPYRGDRESTNAQYCENEFFVPRALLNNSARSIGGVDFLKEPPVSHLNGADVVVLFGTHGAAREPLRYFSQIGPGKSISPGVVEQCSNNPKARVIAHEMRKMRYLTNSLQKKNPATPYEARMRTVSLILTSGNSAARAAFDDFRHNAQATSYIWFKPRP